MNNDIDSMNRIVDEMIDEMNGVVDPVDDIVDELMAYGRYPENIFYPICMVALKMD